MHHIALLLPKFCFLSRHQRAPMSGHIDSDLAWYVVPAVINAHSPEEKNYVLCHGIYRYMTSRFGVRKVCKKNSRKRRHERCLKRLTNEKNKARRDLRRARRQSTDKEAVRNLSNKCHKLLRLHNKATKAFLQAKLNLEALKAKRDCARSFWRFASNIFSEKESLTFPFFAQETFFSQAYSSYPQ